ncbi:MAG: hypothetical protein JRH20_29455, partial [Deltaproteobacteria bacterium]|nr:hypothetical protein [Deltaproteobacteria bacterium]
MGHRLPVVVVLCASLLHISACTRTGFGPTESLPDAMVSDQATRDVTPYDMAAPDAAVHDTAVHDGSLEAMDSVVDALPVILSVEALYPQNGANWLDYVARDGAKGVTEQDDVPCVPGFWAPYHECLHGGELRKVVVTGQDSCGALSLHDQLDVFGWSCNDTSTPIFFHSTSFKRGKGLRDLLDADAFKANKVILEKDGSFVAESLLSTSWWSNHVEALSLNSGSSDPPLELNQSGTLYTVPTSGDS